MTFLLVIINLLGSVTTDKLVDTNNVIFEKEEVILNKESHTDNVLISQLVETTNRKSVGDEDITTKSVVGHQSDVKVDEVETLVKEQSSQNSQLDNDKTVIEEDISDIEDKFVKNENVLGENSEKLVTEDQPESVSNNIDGTCKGSSNDIDNEQDECEVNENLKEHAIIINNDDSDSDIGEKKAQSDQEFSPPKSSNTEAPGLSEDSAPPSTVNLEHQHQPYDEDRESSQQVDDLPEPRPKQRLFPLLYTFRTLFTSFLAEFAGDHTGME